MCVGCKFNNPIWDTCDYEDFTDEEFEHLDDLNQDTCPHFTEVFPDEPGKYWREDR